MKRGRVTATSSDIGPQIYTYLLKKAATDVTSTYKLKGSFNTSS